MRLLVFPLAFMANTFAMMLVMIGLSLFGKPALAADFGLVHGATVALFYSFSGNARSLILGESGRVDGPAILRLRLLLLPPLAVLAFALCIGVVDGGWLFVLLLVMRRAAEWLAEVFLSEQELQHQGTAALRFLLIQGGLSLALLLVLLDDGVWALPLTLVWALSPLLGCLSLALLGRALGHAVPVMAGIRQMLPHFGSTAVIGVSVYVFRLFILLVAGRETAGDLFSAFALGGILGAVFSQALGPTMVRQERSAAGPGRMLQLFNLMLVLVALTGCILLAAVWSAPHLLDWTQKSQLFWLAVGCSLVGGVVMVLAQRIRLRILQDEVGGDVFGSDMLANILLVACIPFVFYELGGDALAALYLLGAVLSWGFYASERSGLLPLKTTGGLTERNLLRLIAFTIFLPLFFQLSGGLFDDRSGSFTSGGVLALLPIPVSVLACYLGIVLLGGYSHARLSLVCLFFVFIGMLLTSLLLGLDLGGEGRQKLVLLVQYILPMFALVLGQQYGKRDLSLSMLAQAGAGVLFLVVPLQLISTLLDDLGYLSPSLFIFSVYQHLQYVPVVFVALFAIVLFVGAAKGWPRSGLLVLSLMMGGYAVLSMSMLALCFMLLACLGFFIRMLCWRRVDWACGVISCAAIGAAAAGLYVHGGEFFDHKFAAVTAGEALGVPANLSERVMFWHFYKSEVLSDWGVFMLGHVEPPDRFLYPSAHNYYLDFIYNFGFVGLLPLILLILYSACAALRRLPRAWSEVELLGLLGVVAFLLLVDNFLKVGLRQPYSGVFVFFIWGVLLARLAKIRFAGCGDSPEAT
jgi:hypothetical protein